jgi:hypothetical protein
MILSSFLKVILSWKVDSPVVLHLSGGQRFEGTLLQPAEGTPEGIIVLSNVGKDENDYIIDVTSIVAIENNGGVK